ncbi:unnamed protein product [Urochloa humidicola]
MAGCMTGFKVVAGVVRAWAPRSGSGVSLRGDEHGPGQPIALLCKYHLLPDLAAAGPVVRAHRRAGRHLLPGCAGRLEAATRRLMAKHDTDGDGCVALSEYTKPGKLWGWLHKFASADGDGSLNAAEFNDFFTLKTAAWRNCNSGY